MPPHPNKKRSSRSSEMESWNVFSKQETFWELHRKLGECYEFDVRAAGGHSHAPNHSPREHPRDHVPHSSPPSSYK
ncbi:hypothetical protein AK812_SmicGene17442 [Symbiodinium microadriaticum]|uniref:Uncharacterized protein n=1 Tax=Symbiodinium microadriaticum TaxID=2951 RepID=A0A1Q9DXR6_SYMMI|nr:hypothetical protein AK812_SmicGene17442 [Symbiodinium microadriaticum]